MENIQQNKILELTGNWIIVNLPDLHFSHKHAVHPPELWNNETPERSKIIWKLFLQMWKLIWELKKLKNAKVLLVLDGDTVDIINKTEQLLLKEQNLIFKYFFIMMGFVFRYIADLIVVVRGTPAHTGTDSVVERILADLIATNKEYGYKLVHNTEDDDNTFGVFNVRINGHLCVFAHQGKVANTAIPETPLVKLSNQMIIDSVLYKKELPRLVLMGHCHRKATTFFREEFDGIITIEQTGCWQMQSEFGYKVAPHSKPYIGSSIYSIDTNRKVERHTYDAPNFY